LKKSRGRTGEKLLHFSWTKKSAKFRKTFIRKKVTGPDGGPGTNEWDGTIQGGVRGKSKGERTNIIVTPIEVNIKKKNCVPKKEKKKAKKYSDFQRNGSRLTEGGKHELSGPDIEGTPHRGRLSRFIKNLKK